MEFQIDRMVATLRVSTKCFSYFCSKTCCGYLLEMPHHGDSNEYTQLTFSGEIRFSFKKCLI